VSTASVPPGLEELIRERTIIVCCGSGGVGKTTAAGAIAVAGAQLGRRTCVVTIDPAKRLADALGLDSLTNEPGQIPGDWPDRGELWALMLDTKTTFDDLVARYAASEKQAALILSNHLYRNIAGALSGTQEYMAMEKLHELYDEGRFDLIVVDTPPTRNALDFIEAPERMAEFFSSRLLRMLIVPYRSRVVNLASRPFYQVADRILGSQFLQDIAEFFILFQTMYAGFVERSQAVARLLRDKRTTFVVVTTLEAAPAHEAEFFIDVLTSKKFHLDALVLNKVLPAYFNDEAASWRAVLLADRAPELAAKVAGVTGDDPAQVERVLIEVGESFCNFGVVAQREASERAQLSQVPTVVASVPYFETDIYDLEGLLRLGETFWT
jgi:anion-transporting  ArsA/GET3 family ATPase